MTANGRRRNDGNNSNGRLYEYETMEKTRFLGSGKAWGFG